jgi:prepilin-type N-terminal cleavage/methylation domain-containing protein
VHIDLNREAGSRPAIRIRRGSANAFSLIEVMVTVALMSFVVISLHMSISSGFGLMALSRENMRATQILQEKMETIRLYSWSQINSNGFIPATFEALFSPTSTSASDLHFSGTVTITNVPPTESYSNDMRLVIVRVMWKSGNVQRTREMQALISRYGLQNYIY